jgi:hypothetical protein
MSAPRAPRSAAFSGPQPAVCRDERPRRAAARAAGHNGLDAVEVDRKHARLTVLFLAKPPRPDGGLLPGHFEIEGGRPGNEVRVVDVRTGRIREPGLDECVVLTLDRVGDGTCYTLRLVGLPRIDPLYASLEFSFRVDCTEELDCLPTAACPPPDLPEPDMDYLAKDYASFRRLILDRLALVMPAWREHHVPDLGITLVELLAYVGDHLSYYQDAVATEAYLDTARQRTSVRRHARLVDYELHDGCNARAWVQVHTSDDLELEVDEVFFAAGLAEEPVADRILDTTGLDGAAVFEPLVPSGQTKLRLRRAHNHIRLYTFGLRECCLPEGATSAVLVDGTPGPPPDTPAQVEQTPAHKPDEPAPEPEPDEAPLEPEPVLELGPGDLLLLEEVIGPETGVLADADPAHRHVVRLTRTERTHDPVTRQPLLTVWWDRRDALPFPLCLSVIGPPPGCALLADISVVRGNVVLADHGRRVPPEPIGAVGAVPTRPVCAGLEHPADPNPVPARFAPLLSAAPLTFAEPLPAVPGPARSLSAARRPRQALPWLRLTGAEPGGDGEQQTFGWEPRRHLLASGPQDRHVVAEPDDSGRARLRFGDGELGSRPVDGTAFSAVYRIGNGPDGNVGAEAINRIGLRTKTLTGVTLRPRNPLPASGGTSPEPLALAKLTAPDAFRRELRRAVTGEDYGRLAERDPTDPAERNPAVQRGVGRLRWTGSWYEAQVAVDAVGGPANDRLLAEIRDALEPYRRVGHDVAVRRARDVALDVALLICVEPHHLRGHVRAALLDVLGSRALPGGRHGLFHPDALSFGEPVHLSRVVAAAQAVAGVESVTVTRFKRLLGAATGELETGVLRLGPLEVARLDNDPAFPEHGRLTLDLRGGR